MNPWKKLFGKKELHPTFALAETKQILKKEAEP